MLRSTTQRLGSTSKVDLFFGAEDVAGRISDYLDQFDTFPGLRSQRLVEAQQESIEYPEEVLDALDVAAARRGLAT